MEVILAPMTRRHRHWVLTLLLPLLALRVLLPAGYMLNAAPDGPRIVMCNAGLAAWSTAATNPADHPAPAASEDCQFAHAAFPAPPPHLVVRVFAPALQVLFTASSTEHLPPSTGPPRRSGARAPPATLL